MWVRKMNHAQTGLLHRDCTSDITIVIIMMPKDQANSAADALLLEANQTRIQNIPQVPRLYRVEDLNALEPRQRLEVVKQAGKNVTRNPRFLVLGIGLPILTFALWSKNFFAEWNYGIFQVLSLSEAAALLFLNVILIRKETVRLVNSIVQSQAQDKSGHHEGTFT